MKLNNPKIIPRNHKVEEALEAAYKNDFDKINRLLRFLKKPYEKVNEINDFHLPAPLSDKKYQTFCGT